MIEGDSDPRALSVAREAARDLVERGAEAVVLVGSHTRGEAGPESDLDLLAVGPETFAYRLERRGDLLVSTSSCPAGAYRRELEDPGSICAAVPGWRGAVVLHDPRGIAAALIEAAKAWTWGPLEQRCDAWVAEEVASLAEEVHKLIAALGRGDPSTAAVQRSILTLRLAPILAVHHRILHGSENRLWDAVSRAMGKEWRRTQNAALGLNGEPFEETCGAAFCLYELAANKVEHLFIERQAGVVEHARNLIDP